MMFTFAGVRSPKNAWVIQVGDGRLGNQVFQFAAILKLFPTAHVVSPSFQTLMRTVELPAMVHGSRLPRIVEKLIRRMIVPLSLRPLFKWLRLGTYVHEPMRAYRNSYRDASGEACLHRGLTELVFFDGGHYQNLRSFLRPADFQQMKIRPELAREAAETLRPSLRGRARPSIVAHVRRGDYLGWHCYGLDAIALPVDYYRRAIDQARRDGTDGSEVIVVTDDSAWCLRELSGFARITVVSNRPDVDFALLTQFETVILSNSTFSLAAACISTAARRIIGPQYWFGHTVGQWLPENIMSDDRRFVYV